MAFAERMGDRRLVPWAVVMGITAGLPQAHTVANDRRPQHRRAQSSRCPIQS